MINISSFLNSNIFRLKTIKKGFADIILSCFYTQLLASSRFFFFALELVGLPLSFVINYLQYLQISAKRKLHANLL